jgi:hypothetical protein
MFNNFFKKTETKKVLNNDLDISEDLFTKSEITEPIPEINNEKPKEIVAINNGIGLVFKYLDTDFANIGYEDALTNPDDGYRKQRIDQLILKLSNIIDQTKLHYNTKLKRVNFHIKTRERAGLIDLVDELNNELEIIQNYQQKLLEYENDINQQKGAYELIAFSYGHGFIKGLAAITVSTILKDKDE